MKSIIQCVKDIVFSFKGKEMSNKQNLAVFSLIEATLGIDAANAFSESMEPSDEHHDRRTTYTYKGDVEFVWKSMRHTDV